MNAINDLLIYTYVLLRKMLKNFVMQNNIQRWERKAKVLADDAFVFHRTFWISYGFEADIELNDIEFALL